MPSAALLSAVGIGLVIGVLLIVILVPLSFSYIEYYEYGLNQRRSTGKVDTTSVYSNGRYATGVDYRFMKYQADAHFVELKELEVFSSGSTVIGLDDDEEPSAVESTNGESITQSPATTTAAAESIGLSFEVDVVFTYMLIQDEVGLLHQELATSYHNVIISRAKDAIKNEAIYVTFNEYFQERQIVEDRFRAAIQNRWNTPPSLHIELDQFHLGRIRIPDLVADKQLESRVQNEKNDMEAYNQQAQIQRQVTQVEVNSIQLEQDNVLRTARAEASLVRSRAKTQREQILSSAQNEGTLNLFRAINITTQEHMTAYTYLRTLQQRGGDLQLDVSYLTSDNVIKTTRV